MKRRTVLGAIGVAAVGGGGYLYHTNPEIVNDVKSGSKESCSSEGKDFGFSSPGFDSIRWVNLDELEITWEDDHNMDGFGIRHEYHDNLRDDLVTAKAPSFSGPRIVTIMDKIKASDEVFPTRTFSLVAYAGTFGSMNFVEDKLGTVNFCIPKSIAPPEKFEGSDGE